MSTEFPDYARVNVEHWNRNAAEWVASGERMWAGEPEWGIWAVSNDVLPLLPERMDGMRAIELGCGTGYVSGWMARRGALVVAIDPSSRQLATARRLASEHGASIEFLEGVAESVPLPDGSFDFAISEYGAAIWADPFVWIAEAHRLLEPGGRLAFLGHGSWNEVFAQPDLDGELGRVARSPYFGRRRIEWADGTDAGVEFNMPVSDWFRLFGDTGFDVVEFYEVQAPEGEMGTRFGVPAAWARNYPSEQAWVLRKR